jgi:hypothetical protein
MPVVGFLSQFSADPSAQLVAAFHKGLSEIGYIDGQNVAIEFRWANNQINRQSELAVDLVRRWVAVIATPVILMASLAAKSATVTIPIVFGIGTDQRYAGGGNSHRETGRNRNRSMRAGISLMKFARAALCCAAMTLAQAAQAADRIVAGTLGGQAPLWPFYITIDKGFFAAEGIDLELNFAQSGAAVTQQLTAGSLDVALSVGITDPI